jgi:carbonic anhydrase
MTDETELTDENTRSDPTATADASDSTFASREYRRIVEENRRFGAVFDRSALTAAPVRGLAVLTCMDARIQVEDALGPRAGDAHIIRNAGGLATGDAIRSLVVSQQLLGTQEILVIAHTRCGLHGVDEPDLRQRLADSTGHATTLSFGAFADLDAMVAEQVRKIREHPATLDVPVHGLVYEVETGRLREVA